MRLLALLALAGLAAASARRSDRAASVPVRVEYRVPKDPAHEGLYVEIRERRLLERLAAGLAVIRLPRALTLEFKECGASNAYYADDVPAIIFCYELLAGIHAAAADNRETDVVTVQDAIEGPTVFFLLHETGHAVFDLLEVPILGKEEDAADHFAAMTLLRMGKGEALRLLKGAAWAFAHDARGRALDESDFADVHSLDAQRYYNLVCLIYGSDPEYFAPAVARGYLPRERADECVDEFRQVLHAMQKLVAPFTDEKQLERIRARHRAR